MTSFETDCIAEKVRWDSKLLVICLLIWLSKTLERQGRIEFGSRLSPSLKRELTAAAFQSLGISDDTKEMLNRLVIRGCYNFGRSIKKERVQIV